MKGFIQLPRLIAALLFLTWVSSAQAALLVVNTDGILMGAQRVSVDGLLYDVRFEDGSCNSLFSGCNHSLFAFRESLSAFDASQALLDSVFLDTPAGNFDSSPGLVNGCPLTGSVGRCFIVTPFKYAEPGCIPSYIDICSEQARNGTGGPDFPDYAEASFWLRPDTDTTGITAVYAVWSRSTVPEPGPLPLICLGLIGMGFFFRRTVEGLTG